MNHFSKERTRLILKSIRTIKITKNLRMTNLFFPLNQKKRKASLLDKLSQNKRMPTATI